MSLDEARRRIAHAKATRATLLDLTELKLTELPAELRELVWLEKLILFDNQLNLLPDWLGNLSQLQHLDVRRNQLAKLPNMLGNLSQLKSLHVNHNRLTRLPDWMDNLSQLQRLDVSFNLLTSLPDSLGNLTQLQELDVGRNVLTTLPDWIGNLRSLKQVRIAENPLNLPDEMIPNVFEEFRDVYVHVRQRTLTFLRQLWQGKRTINEAKVILVGQGDVGKTSLVKRLRDDTFDPHEPKTSGIAIQPWPIALNKEQIQLNLWDFGGQEIMHATHQFFLTKRSLYLLVLDSRQDERANRLEYWLKIIESVAADAPMIIVGNQSDQHPLDLDERGLRLKYPQIKAIIATSCVTGAGIAALREQIEREIGAMKHVHDLVPLKWWDVKRDIEGWHQDYITHERWNELCARHGIDDEFVQAVALRLFNDLGTVLSYHDDPRLADTNVLNPEWVTNGVYTILNHKPLLERKHGILSMADLPPILSVHGRRYPAHRCHFITEMMEKFELCFRLDTRDTLLIPDLLPKEAPDTGTWDDALHFRYGYPILPTSIISRFIVRSQASIEGELRWRSGVVLRSGEGNRALVVADVEAAQIDVRIDGPQTSRRRFLSAIRYTFEQIHNSLSGLKNEIREFVPLPNHPQRLVDYAELLGLEAMNEDRYVDGVLRQRFDLRQLLDGYESAKERRARQMGGDYADKPSEHLQDLADVKRDALQVLELQRAQFGELHVPHHIVTQIEQLTNEIGYIEGIIRQRGK